MRLSVFAKGPHPRPLGGSRSRSSGNHKGENQLSLRPAGPDPTNEPGPAGSHGPLSGLLCAPLTLPWFPRGPHPQQGSGPGIPGRNSKTGEPGRVDLC